MKQIYSKKGFTLLEILIVVALTAIVVGLVFGPLIQTFRFTGTGRVMVKAQDDARLAVAEISRDLADAMIVYDNTNDPIYFPMIDENGDVWTDGEGNPPKVYYAKLDLVLPRMHGYCTAPEGGTKESLEPGMHPSDASRERPRHYQYLDDDNVLQEDENLVEAAPVCPYDQSPLELRPVQPLVADTKIVRYFIGLRDPTKPYSNQYTNSKASGKENTYVLYRAEFSLTDDKLFDQTTSDQEKLNKKNFFYDPTYAAEWKRISRLVVNPDHTDLVTVKYDESTGAPTVTPTVQFTPTAVYDDPLVPMTDQDNNPEHRDLIPAAFKASYGNWILPYQVVVRRESVVYYSGVADDGYMWVYKDDGINPVTQQFNISQYMITMNGQDPDDPSWAGYKYGIGKIETGDGVLKPEMAFTVDANAGTVNFAFPNVDLTESDGLSSILGGSTPVSIAIPTERINAYYDALPYIDRHRMWEFHHPIDRTLPFISESILANQILANSTVVQGYETVTGPSAYVDDDGFKGRPFRYGRVPFWDMFTEPGMNQYKVDVEYTPLDEVPAPVANMEGTAAIYFHSEEGRRLPQFVEGNAEESDMPADSIDPSKPAQGYIDKIYLLFYEQCNKEGDSILASYVTKELITVSLGIKVYDVSSGKPYSVQFTNKVKLRNASQ